MKRTIDIHSIATFSTGLVVNVVGYIGKRSVTYGQYFYASLEG